MMGLDDAEARLYSAQSLWDNTMGESLALARERNSDHLALHINGGFHSRFYQGTVAQFSLRRPQDRVVVVDLVPSTDLAAADAADLSDASECRFKVVVASRARGLNEGTLAVRLGAELEYRLHLPSARPAAGAPLLIWLGDRPLRARDSERLWRSALGDEAAVITIEPPYPVVGEDLYRGARYFWEPSFTSDVGRLLGALDEREHVAHTEDTLCHSVGVEYF